MRALLIGLTLMLPGSVGFDAGPVDWSRWSHVSNAGITKPNIKRIVIVIRVKRVKKIPRPNREI